jgi:hypothetical protein
MQGDQFLTSNSSFSILRPVAGFLWSFWWCSTFWNDHRFLFKVIT